MNLRIVDKTINFDALQVRFRNAVAGTNSNDNWYNDGNIVAFSRGNLGFFAMIKYGTLSQVCSKYV